MKRREVNPHAKEAWKVTKSSLKGERTGGQGGERRQSLRSQTSDCAIACSNIYASLLFPPPPPPQTLFQPSLTQGQQLYLLTWKRVQLLSQNHSVMKLQRPWNTSTSFLPLLLTLFLLPFLLGLSSRALGSHQSVVLCRYGESAGKVTDDSLHATINVATLAHVRQHREGS